MRAAFTFVRARRGRVGHGSRVRRPRQAATGTAGNCVRVPKWKRPVDVIGAVLIGIVAAPIAAIAALLVKLTSRGPVLYGQTRLGLGGRPFTILKLRSMQHHCELLTGPTWATPNDPRITPVGRWLRKLHIDEYPQLWNVLRGEMSLIGPRPERPEIIETLEREIADYSARLRVLPGITGLAQLHVPPDTHLDITRRKQLFDIHYIAHLSFLLDTSILVDTFLGVLGIQPKLTHRHALRHQPATRHETECAVPTADSPQNQAA